MYTVLRTSLYRDAYDRNPITMVARAIDLREPVQDVILGMEQASPGAFVVSDVFEVDEATYADPLKVTLAAVKRLRSSPLLQGEVDMATCYYWNASHLALVNDAGMIAASKPAPLTEEQLRVVLRQIARHPLYKVQTMIQFTADGKMIKLVNGKIEP